MSASARNVLGSLSTLSVDASLLWSFARLPSLKFSPALLLSRAPVLRRAASGLPYDLVLRRDVQGHVPHSILAFQLVSGVKRFREKYHHRGPVRELELVSRMLEKTKKKPAEHTQVASSIPACPTGSLSKARLHNSRSCCSSHSRSLG